MSELRIGVIGCGGHAEGHFRMIRDEPRMRLIAIAEIDDARREAAQNAHGPEQSYDDYRKMLDRVDLDIVYVVTMPGHLLPIVLECLGRGLHTSIEKSPGMNTAETRKMLDASRKSKAKNIVSFNRRYFPEILALRKILQSRDGATHVAAIYHKRTFGWSSHEGRSLAPHPIICDAIHHVDLLRWVAGREEAQAADVEEVYADSWTGSREGTPRCNAIMRFSNGCRAVMMSHYGVGERIQRADAHAEELSAYIDLTRGIKVELFLAGRPWLTPLDLEAVGGNRFNETHHFADCILNNMEPWSTLDDAVKTMELCEAIEQGRRGKLRT